MKQFLITVAGVLVGLTLFAVAAPLLLVAAVAGWTRPAPMAASSVLVLDLRGGLSDQEAQSPLFVLEGKSQVIQEIVQAGDEFVEVGALESLVF